MPNEYQQVRRSKRDEKKTSLAIPTTSWYDNNESGVVFTEDPNLVSNYSASSYEIAEINPVPSNYTSNLYASFLAIPITSGYDNNEVNTDFFLAKTNKHSGEFTNEKQRQFECQQCNKRFNHKQNLTKHLRIHTGTKPFVCGQCNKRFTQKQNLTQHIRIHTGEKPFVCQQCNKMFSKKQHLNRHIRIHIRKDYLTENEGSHKITPKVITEELFSGKITIQDVENLENYLY